MGTPSMVMRGSAVRVGTRRSSAGRRCRRMRGSGPSPRAVAQGPERILAAQFPAESPAALAGRYVCDTPTGSLVDGASPSGNRASCVRDVMASLVKTCRRWYSIVRGERKSCAATSLFDRPSATNRAICSSCGVSSSSVPGSRCRARSPEARSSTRVRCAHAAAPSCSKTSSAARSCARASSRRRSRRRNSP